MCRSRSTPRGGGQNAPYAAQCTPCRRRPARPAIPDRPVACRRPARGGGRGVRHEPRHREPRARLHERVAGGGSGPVGRRADPQRDGRLRRCGVAGVRREGRERAGRRIASPGPAVAVHGDRFAGRERVRRAGGLHLSDARPAGVPERRSRAGRRARPRDRPRDGPPLGAGLQSRRRRPDGAAARPDLRARHASPVRSTRRRRRRRGRDWGCCS